MIILIISIVVSGIVCTAAVGYWVVRTSRDNKASKDASRKILRKYEEVFDEQDRLLDNYRKQ